MVKDRCFAPFNLLTLPLADEHANKFVDNVLSTFGIGKYRLRKLQYNIAYLVRGDKLEMLLGWESIGSRAECLGLTLFYLNNRQETRLLK